MLIIVTGTSKDVAELEKKLALPLTISTWYTYGKDGTELNLKGNISKKAQQAIKDAFKRGDVSSVDFF